MTTTVMPMQRIWAWLHRTRHAAFVLVTFLAVLLVLAGVIPDTVGGFPMRSAAFAFFGIALARGAIALWQWNKTRQRRVDTDRDWSSSAD